MDFGEGDKVTIPTALRDYREALSDNCVPLYVCVKRTSLDHIARHGLRTSDN